MTAALIPTGHEAQSYTCVRSLAAAGVDPIVASEKEGVPAAGSRFCAAAYDLPPPREDLLAYRDALLAIAERTGADVVVPIRPEDSYVLSRYREQFDEVTNVVAPPFETLERAHDRVELAAAAEAAGVPVPETRLPDEVDDWSEPQVVKSRYNVLADAYVEDLAPAEVDVVKDVLHLGPGEAAETDEAALAEQFGHVPIVQEFVPTADEYMFAALYDHGEPVATFQHRQIRGNSYTGGGGVYRTSTAIPELESVGRDLLDELDWHGLACMEYMEHAETGEFVLTELNPRMWQSLPSTVRAGVDFPLHYWQQATDRTGERQATSETGEQLATDRTDEWHSTGRTGERRATDGAGGRRATDGADAPDPGYDLGVGSHLLHGELGYFLSVLREDSPLVQRPSIPGTAWEILASCATEPHFDYLRLDDPGPFLRGIRNKLRS